MAKNALQVQAVSEELVCLRCFNTGKNALAEAMKWDPACKVEVPQQAQVVAPLVLVQVAVTMKTMTMTIACLDGCGDSCVDLDAVREDVAGWNDVVAGVTTVNWKVRLKLLRLMEDMDLHRGHHPLLR